MPTSDDPLEQEGEPGLFSPPPGQDLDLDADAVVPPGDRPRASIDWGVTAAEERVDEPLFRRVRREVPEVDEDDVDVRPDRPAAGRLLEPDSDIEELDVTAEEVGLSGEDDDAGLSAEELAVRVVDEDEL
jgi:hypothetical protein